MMKGLVASLLVLLRYPDYLESQRAIYECLFDFESDPTSAGQ